MELQLTGHIAVVTGASKGIGLAVTRTLLEEGARAGADREAVISTVAPAMMQLATGRLAEPQEIADTVVLLASPRSGSTTGAEFVVDSGLIKAI